MKPPWLFLFFTLACIPGFAQSEHQAGTKTAFRAGYRRILVIDSGRMYKSGTVPGNDLHYRPLEIDIWYPASTKRKDSLLSYGYFLNLLEERSNRFQNDTVYKTLSSSLEQYICANLQIGDTTKLTGFKTNSFLNAVPIQEKFPLIIYMAAFNGMSYENINLFESLAQNGYIVACITSVGRYPGNMGTNMADLIEQVDDGSFAISILKKEITIDSTKIGALGYSWGGLAALVLAINNPAVKVLLSFDGSEFHYYGDDLDEDRGFDELIHSSYFNQKKPAVPYAYLESGFKQNDRDVDSIFNPLLQGRGDRYYIRFPKAVHEDFSCLPSLPPAHLENQAGRQDLYKQFCLFSLNYFNYYLKNQFPALHEQISFIYQQKIGDSSFPVIHPENKKAFIIKGKIIDAGNQESLPYVNVGIPDKNTGTVSRKDGYFQLGTGRESENDSLKFSLAGYTSQVFCIRDLFKQTDPVIIALGEKRTVLPEVVITEKLLPVRILGNTTTSNFISVGLPLKFLGSEIGVKINLGKNPVWIKNLNFNVSDTRLDTAVFRMNIYIFKNGEPGENILQQNIFVNVGKRTGRYTIPLSDFKLIMKGEVLISIEWIEGSSSQKQNGAMFLSAGFLNSATWHRLTSQAKWKKATGMGVGINIEVRKLPKKNS